MPSKQRRPSVFVDGSWAFGEYNGADLRQNACIHCVSARDGRTRAGMKRVFQSICNDRLAAHDRIDMTECLVRTKEIEKLSHGGNRDKGVYLDSIAVNPDVDRKSTRLNSSHMA